MATRVSPLRESCLERIARLLKDHHWDPDLPEDENPFRKLPPVLIEELITCVDGISDERDSFFSYQLQLLIRTGKVRRLKLGDTQFGVRLDEENIKRILKEVSYASRILLSVKIRVWWNHRSWHIVPDLTDALTAFLRKYAQDIKHVESDIPFDFTALHGAAQLEKLTIAFKMDGYPISKLLRVNGQLRPHSFLKELIVEETKHVSNEDIATVLTYCPELISIECDISKSLKMLHDEELLFSDSLSHRYKLQKCHLGCATDDWFIHGPGYVHDSADSLSVRIASVTCPYLQHVTVYLKDFESITALSECCNLDTLEVFWQGPQTANHYNGMRSLLEKPNFGQRLKSLALENFDNVDFDSIGKSCPSLQNLKVANNLLTNISCEVLATSFRKLKCLKLIDEYWQESTVSPLNQVINGQRIEGYLDFLPFGLLSTALDLEEVVLGSNRFTDADIIRMLEVNCLSKLKKLGSLWCDFSLYGLRKLAFDLTSLEYFFIANRNVTSEEIASVFRELNPRVILDMYSDDES